MHKSNWRAYWKFGQMVERRERKEKHFGFASTAVGDRIGRLAFFQGPNLTLQCVAAQLIWFFSFHFFSLVYFGFFIGGAFHMNLHPNSSSNLHKSASGKFTNETIPKIIIPVSALKHVGREEKRKPAMTITIGRPKLPQPAQTLPFETIAARVASRSYAILENALEILPKMSQVDKKRTLLGGLLTIREMLLKAYVISKDRSNSAALHRVMVKIALVFIFFNV